MRISVVVPAHDAEAHLGATLRSALNQTRPPDELIVVDDGSTDGTARVAEGFGAAVRLVRTRNRGAPAARLKGAELATGDALMFLDADDLLGPTALESLADALGRRPDGIAVCPWMRYERRGAAWVAAPCSAAPRRPGQDDLSAWLTGRYSPPCAVLWSRTAYDATGGWDRALAVNQDGDLMMRALASGAKLERAEGGVAYYRRAHGETATVSAGARRRDGLAARLAVLERLSARLAEHGRPSSVRRAAVAEACAEVLRDCPRDEPELRARAEAALRAHGGFGPLRRARRSAMRGVAEAAARLRPEAPPPRRPAAARRDLDPERPLVSVIVPTYNRAASLERAVRSALSQSYRHLELLVVDDGSTDGTERAMRAVADPRLRYLRQDRNRGVAAARNRGMREAAGALIAFLDSDDEWLPGKLDRQVELMRASHPRVGLTYTGLKVREADGRTALWTPSARGDVQRDILRDNIVHFGTSSTMIRREVVDLVGHFDETLPANEDHEYWTRAARFFDFDFLDQPLTLYDNAGGEESRERRSRNFAAKIRAREMFMERHGAEARRAGVRHAFQRFTAHLHIHREEGDPRAARWLLLKALRDDPWHPPSYAWLALSHLPRARRLAIGRELRRLRDGLTRGRSASAARSEGGPAA